MEANKVDMFLLTNNRNFEGHSLPLVHKKLTALDDSRWIDVLTMPLKDPMTAQIISIMAGSMGIDRFYIGDTGLGIAKLLTCGGLGIWTIIDWFIIAGAAREKNAQTFDQTVGY